jgi:hypothetical protein
MPNDWDGRPSWRQQGRSGPNGPRYASRKNRNAVRKGGKASPSNDTSGKSKAAVIISVAIFVPPLLAFLGAVAYVVKG